MSHRDVSATLFGVTAGILLGVGSIAWSQHVAVSATSVSFLPEDVHSAAPADIRYNMRTINQMGVPLRDNSKVRTYPTVKPDEAPAPVAAPNANLPETCVAVKSAVGKIMAVYTKVIPVNVGNTAARQNFDAVFAEVLRDHCPPVAAASSSSAVSVPAAVMINNHCDLYPIHTARYKQCVISEQLGNKYP